MKIRVAMNLPDLEASVTAIGDHLISTDFFSTAPSNKESTTRTLLP
jgi:hypothetical protein